jgi:small subunit ribosomal protein S1
LEKVGKERIVIKCGGLKLDIRVANNAGFCFGVKRAIDMAYKTIETSAGKNVYTLGPLIHNAQVVEKLSQMGVCVIKDINEISEGILVIRSHGLPPQLISEAISRGIEVVDATCPFVRKAQEYAGRLAKDGYTVFIVGDNGHPEVIALLGYTDYQGHVVMSSKDLDLLAPVQKAGVVVQTTQTHEALTTIVNRLLGICNELRVFNTICTATVERQKTALDLAMQSDIMIVIGGLNSANTTRLAELCRASGVATYHVESAEELDPLWFVDATRVGLTAGASTPDWIIEEVVNKMTEISEKHMIEEKSEEITISQEEFQHQFQQQDDEEEVKVDSFDGQEQTEEGLFEEIVNSGKDISDLQVGIIVKGEVVRIDDDGIFVDIGYKSEGIIPKNEKELAGQYGNRKSVKTGDIIDVYIDRIDDGEGCVMLSKKKADMELAWNRLMAAFENRIIIEAKVTERVKGGLLVDVGVRGFVPASHISREYVDNLEQFIGQTIKMYVIEIDRDKNNVVLSRKAALDEEYEQSKALIFNSLREGDIIEGVVKRITSFGAFVDVGSGVDGLLHISEMAWSRIEDPKEIINENDKIKVMVLGIDKENERISLGLKQVHADPWTTVADRYIPGSIVKGVVTNTVDFGAFVKLEDGVEGLIHISQLANRRVEKPEEVVQVGQEVTVKVLNVNQDEHRIGLSLKELEPKPEQSETAESVAVSNETQEEDSSITIGDLVSDSVKNQL